MPSRATPRAKPDAIALLKQDHRTVEELFEKAANARTPDRKQALVRQICTELTIHTTVEEEIFYPACQDRIQDEDILGESYVEHDGAKVLMAELMDGDPDSPFYDAKITVLSEMIQHHVREEEKRSEGLFAQAREAGLDVAVLAEQIVARKEELKRDFAERDLPPPRTRTFTGHELVQDSPVTARGD